MKIDNLLKKLGGIHTIDSIKDILGVSKSKAIYYVYALRKKGYVKTKRLSGKRRLYNISFENKLKGISYEDILNQHSPVKIATTLVYRIYGKIPTLEEVLIYAIKTKSLRTILAALALFRKIKDWKALRRLAKENHIERPVGALYDVARLFIKKILRMPKSFRRVCLPKPDYEFKYMIPELKSKDFQEIEKTWKIYLPFNKGDLEPYSSIAKQARGQK